MPQSPTKCTLWSWFPRRAHGGGVLYRAHFPSQTVPRRAHSGRGARPPCTLFVTEGSLPRTQTARKCTRCGASSSGMCARWGVSCTVRTFRPKRVPAAHALGARSLAVYTLRPKQVPAAHTDGQETRTARSLTWPDARAGYWRSPHPVTAKAGFSMPAHFENGLRV